ncbi:MAG TPA: hypothetical protein VL919_06990 [Vicinamibacterales bacterium]|nr:hypothetical protein [Vicinamibacterales bacterium]
MKNAILIAACLVAVTPSLVAAQTAPKTAEQVKKDVEQTQAIKTKIDEAAQNNPRFVRTLTNVQIELTLTDQIGTNPAEKKTVSMIASSGSWGKIRSAGTIRPEADMPYPVMLNVDARPFVSVEGPVQLELTFEYYPLKSAGEQKEGAKQRPSGVNQSQTVILQSGKPLIVSQAADPISDRKVVVEVKATVLK